MSSSITEGGLVHQGKLLLVHIAENGHSFELDCDEGTLVETVMRYVESYSGIDLNDQLVLCLDMKLEPHRPLSGYKLPASDREVFIFNKARLQSNSPPPGLEQVDVVEVADPPLSEASHESHPLDEASDPALKALPSYERQFRYHFHRGNAIFSRTQAGYEACERLLREQKVQERAVEVGRGNLDQYYKVIHQNYVEFMKRYTHQHRFHSELLLNWRRDLEKLRSVKLHPALQTGSRRILMDFVKEESLRKALESCSNSHKQFEKKVLEFKQMFGEVKRKVEELFAWRASVPMKNLELTIKEHQRFVNEQKSIMQSLSKDVNTVKKLVDDCLSSQLSSTIRPHDAVSALGRMYDVHDKNHLPKMDTCSQSIHKLLEFCKGKKNEMNLFVHDYMQKITYISYIIKDAKLQFPVFREAMGRQDDLFADLKLVRGIGPAYRACFAEIVRRKASMKLYMGMAGQLAERLATKREAEVRRREEFMKAHGAYIPRDVLSSMGLYETPSQCDVNIAPFDTNLLDIDFAELDRFAPEYLACLPFKGDKQGNSQSADADSDELLEGCDLGEIAGTSTLEVENAKLRAELASKIALICLLIPDIECESFNDGKTKSVLKNAAEKTAEALQLKDEYSNHIHSMLKEKQMQCMAYEKRIQELEERLSDQYKDVSGSASKPKTDMPCSSSTSEPMDEVSCVSKQLSKGREDEHMTDSSGPLDSQLDSSMPEPNRDELLQITNSSTAESMPELSSDVAVEPTIDGNDLLLLRDELEEKSIRLSETEAKLGAAVDELALLSKELETSRKLLNESQMNCAHLENCLHEAREEAQTHLCAADRRASEYTTLRASAVKMRGVFERLRTCVYAPGSVTTFADSLRSLAQSLANSHNENEDDGTGEFRKCIRVLAEKVTLLSRHRDELLEKYPKLECVNEQLLKELEEKKELVTTLYKKHQLEKQVNKERISFCRFEVHKIAAFVLNSNGHYVAISRNRPNYYLSAESVALFTDHLPSQPGYIVGQIVHIERQIVKPLLARANSSPVENIRFEQADRLNSDVADAGHHRLTVNLGSRSSSSNPFNLPVGCEYFVVTIAMLPDTAIHSQPTS